MKTSEATSGNETPRLSLGSHLGPEDGTCLMEAVSVYAAEPWSDEPSCTHDLVGHVARLVNDRSSPDARNRLTSFVPFLAGAASSDPTTYPRIAMECLAVASRERDSLLLSVLRRTARLELAREYESAHRAQGEEHGTRLATVRLHLGQRLFRMGPARRSVEVAVATVSRLPCTQRDEALCEMLRRAVMTVSVPGGATAHAGTHVVRHG
jgi:hypothetical protein